MTTRLRLSLVAAFMLACSSVGAQESAEPVVAEAVPLPDDEVRQITVTLLQRYPQLAGSPGVKIAGANLGGSGGSDAATVIYYPHTERRGIKEAVEAHCRRTDPSPTWTCDEVWSRRYLQLASQAFEVRLLPPISAEAALALIEASRRDLSSSAPDVSTAIMITAHHENPGQYFITWGTAEGFSKLTMLAELEHAGNPVDPDDWHAHVFEAREQQ